MTSKESNWQSAETDVSLFVRQWTDIEQPVAVVGIIHGQGEHSGRYIHVADFFAQQNIIVYAYDQIGHGKSGGKRGHVNDYGSFIQDAKQLVDTMQEQHPNLPVFLYGHSMGGNVVMNYLLEHNPGIAGAIITSPWLRLAFAPPAVQLAVGRFVRQLLPKFTQNSNLDSALVSRDPAVSKAYDADEFVHRKISTNQFFSISEAGEKAIQGSSTYRIPTLLLHGDSDQVTDAKATEEMANNLPGDITFNLWEGCYHELHNEPEKFEVLNSILVWMKKRI